MDTEHAYHRPTQVGHDNGHHDKHAGHAPEASGRCNRDLDNAAGHDAEDGPEHDAIEQGTKAPRTAEILAAIPCDELLRSPRNQSAWEWRR